MPVFLNAAAPDTALLKNLQIIAGIIAIAGHIFPVFAGFSGGKGVATMFGVLLALQPLLTLCSVGVFLSVLLVTGIVSVSSMIAGISFPVFLFSIFSTPSVLFRIFTVIVAVALLFTHRKNIERLLKGEEKKLFTFRKKTHQEL